MNKHFLKEDFENIAYSKDFHDLSRVALNILKRMPQPIVQVCGPMATGGMGSLKDNFVVFENTISMLVKRGENVFNQMPFEDPMQRFKSEDWYKGGTQIIDEFYLPIFESRFIKKLYFIRGWETSTGASLEHFHAKRIGIEIVYL